MREKEIERLQTGETIKFRPKGHSMKPRIKSGQLVTVAPVELEAVAVGDVVFCKVKGKVMLHLVKAKGARGFQIGNNRGHINGWTKTIYGKVIAIED